MILTRRAAHVCCCAAVLSSARQSALPRAGGGDSHSQSSDEGFRCEFRSVPQPLTACVISVASLLSPCLWQGPKPKEYLRRGEKEGTEFDYEDKINFAVFPSLQVQSHLCCC